MKPTALVASVLLLGLSASAFAQSAGTAARTSRADSPASTTAAGNHAGMGKAGDGTFMKRADADGMAEVAMGRLALEKSSNSGVKQLAQRIVDDHTKADDQLAALARSKQVTLPTQPMADARKTADAMRKMNGSAFDEAWAKHMVSDHQKAIALFSRESKGGSDADVRNFATATLPVLRTHLQLAQQLSRNH